MIHCVEIFAFYSILIANGQEIEISSESLVGGPKPFEEISCGYPYYLAVHQGIFNGEKVPIYHLNKTAKQLEDHGFTITIHNVFDDILYSFSYSNETFTDTLKFTGHTGLSPVGGKPASRIRAYYMAQLGEKKRDGVIWLCDGVLVNSRWVLTAAHCFYDLSGEPNIVRLGDYDLSEPPEGGMNAHGKFIEDYDIKEVFVHPLYKVNQGYFDLALVKLPREIPKYANSIHPICLPWGKEMRRNFVGTELILTGWGATRYEGPKVSLLQQVNLNVFHANICNSSYFSLPKFKRKFPKGLTDDLILCIGWPLGGKDACAGDSGGPVVFDRESDGKIVLAGIVSTGYGCGLKDFPGIYMPINKKWSLQWIRDIAFTNIA